MRNIKVAICTMHKKSNEMQGGGGIPKIRTTELDMWIGEPKQMERITDDRFPG